VTPDYLVHLDWKASLVQWDRLRQWNNFVPENQACRVYPAFQESKEILAFRAFKEKLVCQACQVCLALMEFLAKLAKRDIRDKLDFRDYRALKVKVAFRDNRAMKDKKETLAQPDKVDHLDSLV